MKRFDRRRFLHNAGKATLGVAGATLLANARSVKAAPANDKIVLGFIAAGGRANQLCDGFLERDDCRVAWVADVNLRKAQALADRVAHQQKGDEPKAVQDFRKVLDDKTVDAVVVATPDHWHALAAVWACQAGKDVYVEKPPTHDCWEGRKMIEAARKYKRVVQVGTQNRTRPVQHGRQKVHRGRQARRDPLVPHLQPEELAGDLPVVPDSDPPPEASTGTCGTARPRRPTTTLNCIEMLAPLLALLGRRHRQRREPPDRPGPLAAGRRVSQDGLFDRRAFPRASAWPRRPTRRWPCSTSTSCW